MVEALKLWAMLMGAVLLVAGALNFLIVVLFLAVSPKRRGEDR